MSGHRRSRATLRSERPASERPWGAIVLDDPRRIRRDRRKARQIPILPAAHASPRAAGIERVSRERRGGVTHRTRVDRDGIRWLAKDGCRLWWGKRVNHKTRNLTMGFRRLLRYGSRQRFGYVGFTSRGPPSSLIRAASAASPARTEPPLSASRLRTHRHERLHRAQR